MRRVAIATFSRFVFINPKCSAPRCAYICWILLDFFDCSMHLFDNNKHYNCGHMMNWKRGVQRIKFRKKILFNIFVCWCTARIGSTMNRCPVRVVVLNSNMHSSSLTTDSTSTSCLTGKVLRVYFLLFYNRTLFDVDRLHIKRLNDKMI